MEEVSTSAAELLDMCSLCILVIGLVLEDRVSTTSSLHLSVNVHNKSE